MNRNMIELQRFLGIALCVACGMSVQAQTTVQVETVPLGTVRLTDGPFKHAEDMDIRYMLALDADRLLAPYLKEAGLKPKASNYTNWENTGLDGHIGGHYLSALSYMYAATGNKEIESRLDYVLSEMKRCQDAAGDGYLCGVPNGRKIWNEIAAGNIRASSFGLNDRWVPLYNIHKTFAGLRDAYLIAGRKDAQKMWLALTDWMVRLTEGLSDEQIQQMLASEHGGLNEVFADAAAVTGKEEYLELARRFSHRSILEPLVGHRDELTGKHANTQIPKVIGFKRIADVEHNAEWDDAARFFWRTVVDNRSISIGGNSVREHFHPSDNFSSMLTSEQGPETCNTYNMLRLTKMLYQTSGDARYMDYYERALFNHILSTVNPVQGGFVYFTPMRSGHYRVYSQPQTSFWCCVGSGLENHAKYGEMIYGCRNGGLYVNLFIPSTLKWNGMEIAQVTGFPEEEATTIVMAEGRKKKFTLFLRIPEWTNVQDMAVTVNDEPVPLQVSDGYVAVERVWKKGDSLRLTLPMSLRVAELPDHSDNVSLMYGPVVLAAKLSVQDQKGMYADDSRGGHIASGPQVPLQDMPEIVGDKEHILSHVHKDEKKPLTFRLTGVTPERYEGMTLEPFNKLHECRYMVYWPVVSPERLKERQERMEREEKDRMALESQTVDKVVCGEQQPESDHFVRMEQVVTGDRQGRQWRKAVKKGWFEYEMKAGRKVRILYEAQDKASALVSVNGKTVGQLEKGNGTALFELPDALSGEEKVRIRIAAADDKETPAVYEVRMMK